MTRKRTEDVDPQAQRQRTEPTVAPVDGGRYVDGKREAPELPTVTEASDA